MSKGILSENSLAMQWLRLHTSTARGTGSIPVQGTKILHATQHGQKKKYIAYVFLQDFTASGLTFKSSIYFEFIFVHGVRKQLILFPLHVAVQFSNTICWKGCLFPNVYYCLLCHRVIIYISVGLFLGPLFCSIDLCVCFCTTTTFFYYCIFVIQFEITAHDTISFVLSQESFGYSGLLFLCKFRIISFTSVKKCHWYFERACIESLDCPGEHGHF